MATAVPTAEAPAAAPRTLTFTHVVPSEPSMKEADLIAKLETRRDRILPCIPLRAPTTCTLQLRADGVVKNVTCGAGVAQKQQARCMMTAVQGLGFGPRKSATASVTVTTEVHGP
jgi:hypothetical protein